MSVIERVKKGLDRSGLVKTWDSLSAQTDYVRGLILVEAKKDCDNNSSLSWEKYLESFQVSGKPIGITYAKALIRTSTEKADLDLFKKEDSRLSNSLKETEAELSLPDSASTQMELRGKSAVDKALNYQEVKESVNKPNPSAGDIRQFNQAKQASSDAYDKIKERCSQGNTKKKDTKLETLELAYLSTEDKATFEEWATKKGYSIVFNRPKLSTSIYGLKDPSVSELYSHSTEWKSFFRSATKKMHPDSGGTEIEMQWLNRLNNLMSGLSETYEYNDWNNKVMELKKEWKKDSE